MRRPAVAGMFYELDPEDLKRRIEWCFRHPLGPGAVPKIEKGPRNIVGLVCPHAGYMYSGPVAAWSYKALAENGRPELFVIIGPNHTGYGAAISIMTSGVWSTPLGNAIIDEIFAKEILDYAEIAEEDIDAHISEHSIEVQLPFLQYLYGEVRFVPICMMLQTYEAALKLGEAIAKASEGRDVVIIASTDLTHYEPHEMAREKDEAVIRQIVNLNAKDMMDLVYRRGISMCGPGPVATAIIACKRLGAEKAVKLKYATSGDVTGDYGSVVGYASIAIYR